MESKKLLFYIDCLMNVEQHKINESLKKLSLFQHWLVNFDRMKPNHRKEVVNELFELLQERELFKDNVNIEELLEEV